MRLDYRSPLRECAKFLTLLQLMIVQCAAEPPIEVGWIGPLTGPAAVLGVDSVPAIELVFDRVNSEGGINGRTLKLVVEDDQYQTAKTVTAYERLAKQRGIEVIFTITYGGLFAIAKSAERAGTLLIDPLDCDDQIASLPENVICVAKKTEDLGAINARHALKEGLLPAAFIYYEGDPFMGTAAEASISTITQGGGKVIYRGGYQSGEGDFKSRLLKVKESGARSVFFYGYDEMGIAVKQARSLGITAQLFGMNTITSPGFQSTAAGAAEGMFAGSWYAPKGDLYDQFMKDFKSRVGRAPTLEISTVPSFDVANLIVNALRKRKAERSISETVKSYLYTVKDYNGASGTISIDSDGITRSLKNEMYIMRSGRLERY